MRRWHSSICGLKAACFRLFLGVFLTIITVFELVSNIKSNYSSMSDGAAYIGSQRLRSFFHYCTVEYATFGPLSE